MTSHEKICLIMTPKTEFRLYAIVDFRCIGAVVLLCSKEFVRRVCHVV